MFPVSSAHRSIWLSNELDNSNTSKIQIQIQHYQTVNIIEILRFTTRLGKRSSRIAPNTKILTRGREQLLLGSAAPWWGLEDIGARKGRSESSARGPSSSPAKSFPSFVKPEVNTSLNTGGKVMIAEWGEARGRAAGQNWNWKSALELILTNFAFRLCFLFQIRTGLFVYNLLHLGQHNHLSK